MDFWKSYVTKSSHSMRKGLRLKYPSLLSEKHWLTLHLLVRLLKLNCFMKELDALQTWHFKVACAFSGITKFQVQILYNRGYEIELIYHWLNRKLRAHWIQFLYTSYLIVWKANVEDGDFLHSERRVIIGYWVITLLHPIAVKKF